MAAPYTGNGTTITFGTTGSVGNVIDIGDISFSRESVASNHLGTNKFETYLASDYMSIGETSCRVILDPSGLGALTTKAPFTADANAAMFASSETITITFPDTKTLTGSGFITGFSYDGVANNSILEGTVTFQFDGVTGPAQNTA